MHAPVTFDRLLLLGVHYMAGGADFGTDSARGYRFCTNVGLAGAPVVPAIPAYLRYLRPHLRHSHRMNSIAIVFESHTRVYPVHTCDPTCVIYTATLFSRGHGSRNGRGGGLSLIHI